MLKNLFAALLAVVFLVCPAMADGKVTLKHGPIKNLDMEGMTMVFRVADPAMLDKVKAGDKVEFEADRVNGAITVTKIGKGP